MSKLVKIGSSIGVILPKGTCRLLKLNDSIGKPVNVSINKEKNNMDKKGVLEVELFWSDWEESIFD